MTRVASPIPEFGSATPEVEYVLRPGGYAVIINAASEVAVVATPQGRFLPGGGQEAGESPQAAAVRETREECGLHVKILSGVAAADQLVFAADEGVYYRKRCTFFLAEVAGRTTGGEPDHQLVWLPAAEALVKLRDESQRWALGEALKKAQNMEEWYRPDLAYIHDDGFRDWALKSAPGILEVLSQTKREGGLVVDLGCGSGLWARELVKAGYRVLGIDISAPMIELARRRVPEAEFRVESLFQADLPPCAAVTSISECLNYLFDSGNNFRALRRIFRRVYRALTPGGVFIFDVAEPGQVRSGVKAKGFTEGKDWLVLVEKDENPARRVLTRRIISFRQVGAHYRRSEEVHRQRLYQAAEIARELRRAGFRVRAVRSYGRFRLPKAHAAFIARKPA